MTDELDLDSSCVQRGTAAPNYFVYVLCSRNHRHLSVDCSPSLVQGVKFTREAIARRLGRKRTYQKLVYRERVEGLSMAVSRCNALKSLHRAALKRIIARTNPLMKPLSTRVAVKSAPDQWRLSSPQGSPQTMKNGQPVLKMSKPDLGKVSRVRRPAMSRK